MKLGSIYAITDPRLLPNEALYRACEQALRGGVKLIQLRDKLTTNAELIAKAKRLGDICRRYNASLIINDRIDVAIAAAAQGVHLGQDDEGVTAARQRLGAKAIIGVTCHNDLALARSAEALGASYVAFGRFFPSSTKPLAHPATKQILATARTQLRIPTVAIGGINLENMGQLVEYGADYLALCHGLFATEDIKQRAETLIEQFTLLSPNRINTL